MMANIDANPPTGDKSVTSAFTRASRILLAVFLVAAVCGGLGFVVWAQAPVFVWAQASFFVETQNASQRQSVVMPFLLVSVLARQMAAAEALSEWNLPVWPAVYFVLWLQGVLGFGYFVTQHVLRLGRRGVEQLLLSFGIGLSATAVVVLTVGVAGGARAKLLGWVSVSILILTLPAIVPLYRQISDAIRGFVSYGDGQRAGAAGNRWLRWLPGLVIAVFLLFLAVACLTPPIRDDAMRYHLAAPQEFLKLGRVGPLALNAFGNFPFLLEMHYMLALAAGAAEASQLMHLACALFTSLAIAYAAWLILGRGSRVFAYLFPAVAYLCVPASAISATWPNVDHATALYSILSALACYHAITGGRRRDWLVAGLLLGAATATKYTMLANVAVLGLLSLVVLLRRKPLSYAAAVVVVLAAGFAVTGLPWFAKNAVMIKNPVYPLMNSVFGGGDWTLENQQMYLRQAGLRGIGKTIVNFAAAPFYATFEWIRFEGHNVDGILLIAVGLVLPAVLLVRLRRRARMLCILLACISAFGWTLWFFTYQSNRFLLPVLATALPLAAIPLNMAWQVFPRLYKFAAVSFSVVLCHGAMWSVQWIYFASDLKLGVTPLPYFTGQVSFDSYMSRWQNHWPAFTYVDAHVKPGEKVMVVGEHRIYGAKFTAVWSDWFNTPVLADWIRNHHIQNIDELLRSLQTAGINWIIIDQPEIALQGPTFVGRFHDREKTILEALLDVKEPVATRREINKVIVLHLSSGGKGSQ